MPGVTPGTGFEQGQLGCSHLLLGSSQGAGYRTLLGILLSSCDPWASVCGDGDREPAPVPPVLMRRSL